MVKRVALVVALAASLGAVDARAVTVAGAVEPTFDAKVQWIGPKLRERMTGRSWHPGCPVPLRNLRLITLKHWAMDGRVITGRLVVRRGQAENVIAIMRRLFELRFKIRRMVLIDAYGGSDARSMDADNTSAFNCRFVAGTTRWSEHAYGRAIDVNPLENPYVSGSYVSPEAGRPHADRDPWVPGMIRAATRVVEAFERRGWEWGGYWSSPKDYMHFSATGR